MGWLLTATTASPQAVRWRMIGFLRSFAWRLTSTRGILTGRSPGSCCLSSSPCSILLLRCGHRCRLLAQDQECLESSLADRCAQNKHVLEIAATCCHLGQLIMAASAGNLALRRSCHQAAQPQGRTRLARQRRFHQYYPTGRRRQAWRAAQAVTHLARLLCFHCVVGVSESWGQSGLSRTTAPRRLSIWTARGTSA